MPWTIGIANPNLSHELFSYMNITDMAVPTSGNYKKFVTIDGKRYSHTIDPKTVLPVNGIKSVTIISTNAEIADAMATPVTVIDSTLSLDGLFTFVGNQAHPTYCLIENQSKSFGL